VRPLLIFICNPTRARLPTAFDEAAEVSQYCPAAIVKNGTAADLRRQLVDSPTKRFLFIGHSGLHGERGQRTLGFTEAESGQGAVKMVSNADIAALFKLETVELVFLNGCNSEELGRLVRAEGVPYVVCWASRTEDRAARLFSASFFHSYMRCKDYRQAFAQAKLAVKMHTKSGQDTPVYELCDPDAPSTRVSDTPGRIKRHAAGVPLLLCDELEGSETDGRTCGPTDGPMDVLYRDGAYL